MHAAQDQRPVVRDAANGGGSVQAAFCRQARDTPSATALLSHQRRLTYAELDDASSACAAALREHGAGPGRRVGILMSRSIEAVIAMLGILKTGAAFVPFDVDYPIATLIAMALETEPVVMLVDRDHPVTAVDAADFCSGPVLDLGVSTAWRHAGSCDDTLVSDDPNAPAYVMYTSGSTGQPKGVVVPHRGVLRLVIDADYASLGPSEVILQLAPLGFDACVFEIFAALLNGGTLAIVTMTTVSLDDIADAIASFGVTTLWLTAGLFHLMVDQRLEALRGLRQLLAGGDRLSPSHVRRLLQQAPTCRLINGYGPTENTTFTCCYPIPCDWDASGGVPVGSPINGTVVHILNDNLLPVAEGETGELCAAGQGVALGYLNRAEETARCFVQDPFGAPGSRLYRTGDLVRRRSDGIIEFVGRMDRQVKINGRRIELDGIEAALRSADGVRDAAAIVAPSGAAMRILAFAVATPRPGLETALGRHLAASLPAWMRPSCIIVLDALPLTGNGKLDRRALPALAPAGLRMEAPRQGLEQDLARIWTEVLDLAEVDRGRNFFDLGATSLQIIALQAAIHRELGRDLPIVELFAHPTVAALAAHMDGSHKAAPLADVGERAERQSRALRSLSLRMKTPLPEPSPGKAA